MWKEPQRDRAQQEQAFTQPISVRTPPSCRFTQMCHTRTQTHSPHICFISSCSLCKHALERVAEALEARDCVIGGVSWRIAVS